MRLVFIILLLLLVSLYTWYTISLFSKINDYISDEVWYPPSALNILRIIFHTTPYMYIGYPQNQGIQNYLNPEHPPLAKYLMAIFILFLGYQPIAWRIPGWILGSLGLIIAFLITLMFFKDPKVKYIAGLLSALMVALDPNFWVMHGIAMLDAYAGFFGLLSLYLLLSERKTLSGIGLGLAAATKESMSFLIFPFLYYLGEFVKKIHSRVIYGIVIPIITYGIISIPFILYYGGVTQWLQNTVLHSLSWAISSGHISPGATSQISAPWQWFLNINPFFLGYDLYAKTNPLVMLAWIILTPIAFILKDQKMITTTMYAWSIWLGFIIVYFLGNNTLFSFYVSDFSPIVDVYVVVSAIKTAEYIQNLIFKWRGYR
jgi:predicted membrane-bound dolichyl-phosphate-mannose-protein mannosyltransferase